MSEPQRIEIHEHVNVTDGDREVPEWLIRAAPYRGACIVVMTAPPGALQEQVIALGAWLCDALRRFNPEAQSVVLPHGWTIDMLTLGQLKALGLKWINEA